MSEFSHSFEEVGWYKATTLSERIELRRHTALPLTNEKNDVAAKLSRRWRSQVPFSSARLFSQRLESLALSDDEFLAVLAEPATSIRFRSFKAPSWLEQLSQAYSSWVSNPLPDSPELQDDPIFGLLNIAKPLVSRGLSKLRSSTLAILEKHSHLPVKLEMLEEVFLGAFAKQLLAIVSKVAVLEMHVARVQGHLHGETQPERYRNFVERLQQPETALAMMLEYPVLARQLVQRIEQWVDFIVEFLRRLCSDWDLILRSLGSNQGAPGFLIQVQSEAGDPHRGGRSVVIATFSSGFKVVYKPKSLAVDAHFQELLTWINGRGSHPPLRTLKILDRGSYGWSEFVIAKGCSSSAELQRFYRRQGAYLALLYVLEATDFHSENIIAAGEDPVLIDLEAIFHPRLQVPDQPEEADIEALTHSVLRVGLLPRQFDVSDQSHSADLSGLSGGSAGQLTPYKVAYWDGVGTDEMRLSRRQIPMPANENRPSLNEVDIVPSDYIQEVLEGFTGVYRLLMTHRDALLAPDGLLRRFAEDEVRVIFRATKTYGVLLNESFHPDVLRDALERDLLFDRLWIAVEAFPYLAKVISAECEDLQRGDIPFFRTRPNGLHVWTSADKCIPHLFEKSSLSLVEQRLQELNEGNLELQRWLIRASMATTVEGGAKVNPSRKSDVEQPLGPVDRMRLLSAACTVGDKLEHSAIRSSGGASWVGLSVANQRQWCTTTAMLDLYDGLPGIALFLAYLGSVSGENRYTALARETCNMMLHRMERYELGDLGVGAFAGWGGTIYALTHLGSLWHDASLLGRAKDIAQSLYPLIACDESLDIIAGSAGCIASLVALCRQRSSSNVLAAARACGNHLISRARQMPAGIGWIIPEQRVPLSGFAHGAAGFAWALCQLAELTGETVFGKTAEAAIAYERSLFDPGTMNWFDLRTWDAPPQEASKRSMCAWCHGAAGIGLARFSMAGQFNGDEVQKEIDAALNTTIRTGFGDNHSLCHGDLGNLELLINASRVLKDERCQLEAQRIAHEVMEAVSGNECRCGTPLHVDSPGLMTGLAGIGYGLLRMAASDRVPSVLTLQPAIES